jgi:hypothetical protein
VPDLRVEVEEMLMVGDRVIGRLTVSQLADYLPVGALLRPPIFD